MFLCQSMIFTLKTSNRKFYMPYKSMSLKKPNTLNMNKRSEPLFQKRNFSPPGMINFSNFFITPPKTFLLSLGVAGKEILTLSALSRPCQFLPLSDRTIWSSRVCLGLHQIFRNFDILYSILHILTQLIQISCCAQAAVLL